MEKVYKLFLINNSLFEARFRMLLQTNFAVCPEWIMKILKEKKKLIISISKHQKAETTVTSPATHTQKPKIDCY